MLSLEYCGNFLSMDVFPGSLRTFSVLAFFTVCQDISGSKSNEYGSTWVSILPEDSLLPQLILCLFLQLVLRLLHAAYHNLTKTNPSIHSDVKLNKFTINP
jgi:hypothetical protein